MGIAGLGVISTRAVVERWLARALFVVDKTFGTVIFHVPVVEIGLILVAAYVATLFTTFLPARAAPRVAPAEALRYE